MQEGKHRHGQTGALQYLCAGQRGGGRGRQSASHRGQQPADGLCGGHGRCHRSAVRRCGNFPQAQGLTSNSYITKGLLQNRPFFLFPCCSLARLASTLRWAQFLHDEKLGKESLRAFPPKNPPWGTGLVVRQAYGRPWFGANSGKQLLLARRTARQAVRCLPSRALVGSVAAVPGCRKPGFRRLGTAAAPRKGPDKNRPQRSVSPGWQVCAKQNCNLVKAPLHEMECSAHTNPG